MTTILTRHSVHQLSPGGRMNDTPAESGSRRSDRELQLLVLEIQASTDRTNRVVRKQIDRLLKEITIRLGLPKQVLISNWSGIANIESIVAVAVNNTLIEALKNIDRYNPDKASVMTWVNGILRYRFLDTLPDRVRRDLSISFDNPDAKAEAKVQEKIDKDNAVIPESETAYMAHELRRFINKDPEGHLSNAHIRGNPAATFKAILLMRIEGLIWQSIADRLDIPRHSTVSGFHDRQLHNLGSYFRKYLCRHLRG
jgi:DNA-directed RNA polymerase specialized sigma24 family protein